MKQRAGKNNSANINGVISLSSTTGLRTIHLLRSILFRALPSHAIRADLKACVRRNLNTKSETSCDPGEHNASVAACSRTAAEIPSGFHGACRSCSLTQLNLPVVASVAKYSWFQFEKCLKPILSTSTGLLFFVSITNFYVCYSPHFTNIDLVLFIDMKIALTRPSINPTVVFSTQNTQKCVALPIIT